MKAIALILTTIVLSAGASYFIWRTLLDPPLTPLPPPPTLMQQRFGQVIFPALETALEKALPADFETRGGLEATLRAMSVAAGVRQDAPVRVRVAGMPFGDAIVAVLAEQRADPPLYCEASKNTLVIDAKVDGILQSTTRSYNVVDLAPTTQAVQKLVADVRKSALPQSWRKHPGYFRVSGYAGQLWVNQSSTGHREVVTYLNNRRLQRGRAAFASRAGVTIGASVLVVSSASAIRFFTSRRGRRKSGLCLRCGYDLRASSDRCPECGLQV